MLQSIESQRIGHNWATELNWLNSVYRLHKQGDITQPWGTPFSIWKQSVVPCPVLTVASWLHTDFSRDRYGGLVFPSLEELSSLLWSTQSKAFSSVQFSSVTQSCLTLRSRGLQHIRPPCPSPTPGAYSNSCSSSRWCLLTISSSVIPFSSHLQSSVSIRVFSNESVLHIRWPKYWSFSFSFSISPSNEYSGLISFTIDGLDLLAVQGTLKSLL